MMSHWGMLAPDTKQVRTVTVPKYWRDLNRTNVFVKIVEKGDEKREKGRGKNPTY